VIDAALRKANTKEQLSAIAFTQGPAHGFIAGGSSFAKSIALALKIPLLL
jgi:tRNA A37 threonylcarbamoyltransferase TsaD